MTIISPKTMLASSLSVVFLLFKMFTLPQQISLGEEARVPADCAELRGDYQPDHDSVCLYRQSIYIYTLRILTRRGEKKASQARRTKRTNKQTNKQKEGKNKRAKNGVEEGKETKMGVKRGKERKKGRKIRKERKKKGENNCLRQLE